MAIVEQRRNRGIYGLGGPTVALSLLFAPTAQAQTASPATTVPATAQETADEAGNAIVVTAQRREERLQDVPVSITAFTGDALQQLGVVNTQDLTQVTPGLNFTQSSFSPQPTIRGIGTRGVSASDESVVPVYIDGVYQPFLGSTVTELNSIERVEVLRGPQTALYGRNSTGGAINIITSTPRAEPMMKASLSFGSFEEVIAKGYVTGGNEWLQGSVSILYRDDDGYLRNRVPGGGQRRGDTNSFNLRTKLRFTPTANLAFTGAVSHIEHHDTISTSSQPYLDNTTVRRRFPSQYVHLGPYEQNGTGGALDMKQDSVSLTGNLALGAVDLTAITAYDNTYLFTFADVDGTQVNLSSLPTDYYSKSFSQEVYATSAGSGPFKYIVGASYFWRDSGTYLSRVLGLNNVVASSTSGFQKTNAYAVYAQGTYDLTDALSVTLAGRYTTEKKVHQGTNNLTRLTTTGERTFHDFSPSGTIQYDFSPDANIYARAGKGFKSGLFPANTVPSASVEPETVWQYELGTKFSMNGWLRANLDGFYTDYSNIQVNIRPNNVSTLQNAGKAEIYGIEGELFAEPIDKLNLRIGVMKLWGEFKDFPNAVGTVPCTSTSTGAACPTFGFTGTPTGGNMTVTIPNAAGNKMIRTPFFTISAGANYAVELADGGQLGINANVYHAGKEYRDADNRVTLPGYTVVNGELSYRFPDSDVKLSLWARNLFDEVYNVYILTGATADTTVYAKPRTVGARLDMKFGG